MYKEILEAILETMNNNDYSLVELETTTAINKRNAGESLTFNEHIEGLIWSLLSNQRPWKGISDNKDKIRNVFHNFDFTYIMNENPSVLAEKLIAIKCGNRAIRKQMESLNYNINKLIKIKKEFGTIDKFIMANHPSEIAKMLSNGEYKLKQIGFPLAMEYLRNVGIDAIKPDVHICRILGSERLGLSSYINAKENEAVNIIRDFANETKLNCSEIDYILWQFCSTGYGEICTKNPKCEICKVKKYCNYKK